MCKAGKNIPENTSKHGIYIYFTMFTIYFELVICVKNIF